MRNLSLKCHGLPKKAGMNDALFYNFLQNSIQNIKNIYSEKCWSFFLTVWLLSCVLRMWYLNLLLTLSGLHDASHEVRQRTATPLPLSKPQPPSQQRTLLKLPRMHLVSRADPRVGSCQSHPQLALQLLDIDWRL